MKLYLFGALFAVLVRCPVSTPVRTSMYGLPSSQSDHKIRSVFQSVYNNTVGRVDLSCKQNPVPDQSTQRTA